MKISVIIPTIGEERKEKLKRLLSEIEKQTFKDYEILVIEGDDRQGRAINRGAARAKGRILIILDDDVSLGREDLFGNMIRVLEADRSIGMAGASTISRPNDSIFQKLAVKQVPRRYFPVVDEVTESDMAHHPCCAIPKTVFEEIGGENETLIRGLDPELRFRIRNKGYKIVIAPHSWIYHPLPESMTGVFREYFRNGKGAAFAYRTDPGLVYEVGDRFHKTPVLQKTKLSYRMRRFIGRFIRNIIAFRIIALAAMTGYGLGYAIGFSTYKKSYGVVRDYFLYNIAYLAATVREVLAIYLKEVVVKRNTLFKNYLRDRLALYNVKRLGEKYKSKRILWIHANTLGEMRAAIKLSKILKEDLSGIAIIASTTELAAYCMTGEGIKEIDEVIFLPFDLTFLINRAFKAVRPELFVTIEKVLWPNLFIRLNGLGIKTMLIDGYGCSLDKEAARCMISKRLLPYFLNKIEFLGMRSREFADELIKLGVDSRRIGITGWLKLDMPADFPAEDEKNAISGELCLKKGMDIIIAGSTWQGEEEIFLAAFREIVPARRDIVMVLAPRHLSRVEEVCDLVRKAELTPKKRKLLSREGAAGGDVIVLDTLGELYKIYGIAKLSIIGGTFIRCPGVGGNVAEPLLRGSPVIIGPYAQLWGNPAEEMGLKKVNDYKELKDAIGYLLDNPDNAILSRDFALKAMERYRGSYAKCAGAIARIISG